MNPEAEKNFLRVSHELSPGTRVLESHRLRFSIHCHGLRACEGSPLACSPEVTASPMPPSILPHGGRVRDGGSGARLQVLATS